MRRTLLHLRLPLAAALLLLASCASSRNSAEMGDGAATGQESTVTVQNNHPSLQDMTIVLQPDAGGTRVTLGVVPAGQTRIFEHGFLPGQYHLVARRAVGGDIHSERFNAGVTSAVRWNTSSQRVTVSGR